MPTERIDPKHVSPEGTLIMTSEQTGLIILPPQISSDFIDRLSKTMKLSRDRFVDVCANQDLFTSSLPYALQYVREQGRVQPGDIGLLISVGAGIQVGCATYYF